MAAAQAYFVTLLLLLCLVQSCCGNVTFSSLQRTLEVVASPAPGEVLKAGESSITVTWAFNQTWSSGIDSSYKTIKAKLCYAPVSQKDRGWRKTEDSLEKDKTCQFLISAKPYSRVNNSVVWTIEADIAQATYFVRVYASNSEAQEVGFSQTTNKKRDTYLFVIQTFKGRHFLLDIASVCFSVLSVVALAFYFDLEIKKAKADEKN